MNPPGPKYTRQTRLEDVIERATLIAALLALFVFTYFFFEIAILTIGAIITAVAVSLVAEPFEYLKFHRWISVTLSVLILTAIAAGTAYLFGTRLAVDIQDVVTRMTQAENTIRASLEKSELGKILLSHASHASSNIPIAQIATNVFRLSARFAGGAVVAVIAGIYIAAQPTLYLDGFLILFPHERRPYAKETILAAGNGLYRWLEGQFITMFLIGLLSSLAWWAIGLPSPFGLGLIAGVAEFIPYVGPIIAAIPALLVAATQSPGAVLWTFVAYIVIHALEGNIISPLIQRELVYVPPALMLLGIAAITIVFGTAAILFAAPIVVVVFVLIKKLYVRDSLGEPASLPGEEAQE